MLDTLQRAIAAQYDLIKEIGRGGMGVVYLARDRRLDRQVAIKVLPPHLATDEQTRERFVREARTAASLSHPHIVPIFHADEIDGQVFFVMGYVDGESLAQRLRRDARPRVREVLAWLRDVAHALGYAHERGVVHRDIKAENILIDDATGRALVTDFGIARLAAARPMTATGQILGTVYYMSPEQVIGEELDGRSDIYSLGVVAFAAFAGRFPFESPLASAILVSHVNRAAPSIGSVAPALDPRVVALIDRCLSKDRAARPATAAELAAALDQLASDVEDIPTAPPSPLLVSPTEAGAIWKRAAELQAMTSQSPAPTSLVRQRDHAADAARTSGYSLEEIRAGARGSLIHTQAIDRALAERGIGSQASAAYAPTIVQRNASQRPSRFLGAHSRVDFESTIEREFSDDELDDLVEEVRRTVGNVGTVTQLGRSITWTTSEQGSHTHVTLTRKAGRTTIRAVEDLKQAAIGVFGAMGLGGGVAGSAMTAALIMKFAQAPLLAVASIPVVAGTLYGFLRLAFREHYKERHKVFEDLLTRLAIAVAESRAPRLEDVKPKPALPDVTGEA